MKNLITIFIIFVVIISCQNEINNQNNIKISSADSSANINKNVQNINTDTLVPSDQFIKLVKFIDSCNYIWDTNRIKKVYCYPVKKNYKIIDKYLFYKMTPPESDIVYYYNKYKDYKTIIVDMGNNDSNKVNTTKIDSSDSDGPIKKGLVKIIFFNNPKAIWGYFYRHKTEKNFITDGFIEQWEFPSSTDALNAYNEINRVKDYVFFNTESFCYKIDKNVFVFYCRAAGFSNQLKKFYEYLKRN